ncbi:MAG TPA: transcription antitermination factor NusB [Candidatus Babeliales bacterium]|jgi:N utilization substance protein B|nr:transcription antitermination factor NusB [Candidatus Babeliales bacterium]
MCSLFLSPEDNNLQESEQKTPKSYDDLSRRDVRSLAFHFLYAAEAFNYEESVQSIIDNFNRGFELNVPLDGELFNVVNDIINKRDELEKIYEPYLANWRSERISVCTKLILLFAVWELKYTETDSRIVINEAIELAKCFAEEDAYRFVNGILDSVSKELRKELSINTES